MKRRRNKKTGEIIEYDEEVIYYRKLTPKGHNDWTPYHPEDWEDYTPTEPLIKDLKARKVFREWADLIGAERFRVNHFRNAKTTMLTSTDLITEPSIELPGHIGKDSEIYTIIELIGEEK